MKQLRLVLQEREVGRPPTEAQKKHRERFAQAATEAKKEMAGSRLRGAERVVRFNQLVAQKLRESP